MRTTLRWIVPLYALLATAHANESWQYSATGLTASDTAYAAPIFPYRRFLAPALLYCTACIDVPQFSSRTWSTTPAFALPRFVAVDAWDLEDAPVAEASNRIDIQPANFLLSPELVICDSTPGVRSECPAENRSLRFSLAEQTHIRLVDNLPFGSGYRFR